MYFAANATGRRQAVIRLNGTTNIGYLNFYPGQADDIPMHISTLCELASGDYIELLVYQNSGGDLILYKEFLRSSILWMKEA